MPQQRRQNGFIVGVLSLGLLAGAALMASPAQAVSGPGPYYPEAAWDQIKGADRFLVLTDWASAAVLDKETGLVWEQSPVVGATTWSSRRISCIQKTVGNRKGWRLPSIPELASLVDPSVVAGPRLPAGHPFTNVQMSSYWSATTDDGILTSKWFVDFGSGVASIANVTTPGHAWCVRGGMNADAY